MDNLKIILQKISKSDSVKFQIDKGVTTLFINGKYKLVVSNIDNVEKEIESFILKLYEDGYKTDYGKELLGKTIHRDVSEMKNKIYDLDRKIFELRSKCPHPKKVVIKCSENQQIVSYDECCDCGMRWKK